MRRARPAIALECEGASGMPTDAALLVRRSARRCRCSAKRTTFGGRPRSRAARASGWDAADKIRLCRPIAASGAVWKRTGADAAPSAVVQDDTGVTPTGTQNAVEQIMAP